MPATATGPLHLTPHDYHVIAAEDFGAPGLSAQESIGPFVDINALGWLLTVHDSRFEARSGIGHHPHQRMERLFYILEGRVDHDDVLNHITGHMDTGDLGILTEGQRGMIHSEWNHGDGPARAYIFVTPTDPTPATAAFDAVRDAEAPRREPAAGVRVKHVIDRGSDRLHSDLRELADTTLDAGAQLEVALDADEAALLFLVEGAATVRVDGHRHPVDAGREHTVLLPPAPQARSVTVAATEPARLLHAATGQGFGLRRH